MAMVLDLEVQYGDTGTVSPLPTPEQIEAWVRAALEPRLPAAQLVVRIVDEIESRDLNERYRHGSGPTNVLSFPFEQPDMLDPPLLGDVLVCAPVVKREADEQDKPVDAHWAHMVVHGVLHLSGYDHETDGDAAVMEQLEQEILASLGIGDPYAPVPAQA